MLPVRLTDFSRRSFISALGVLTLGFFPKLSANGLLENKPEEKSTLNCRNCTARFCRNYKSDKKSCSY